MNKKHIGSNFDDWLKEIGEGYFINISACKHFKGIGECEIMEGLCVNNECYYKENERLKQALKEAREYAKLKYLSTKNVDLYVVQDLLNEVLKDE